MDSLSIRFLLVIFIISLLSYTSYGQKETTKGAVITEARLLGSTGPIKDKLNPVISNIQAKKKLLKSNFKVMNNFNNTVPMKHNNLNPLPNGVDPLRQLQASSEGLISIEPIVNIDGIDFDESKHLPPDSNGDVNSDYYVQTTNGAGGSIFNVYDKEGHLLMGPTSMNIIWEDFGLVGLGDPVVLWDQGAGRWLFTEICNQGSTFLIAISETSDPMGSFLAYEFQTPNFPDYPHYGVWNDAYYVTTNEKASPDIPIYVIDRDAMLNGDSTISIQAVGISKFPANDIDSYTHQVATPADWDGVNNPPPIDAPHLVMRLYDDAWDGGQDKLEIWEIDVDWGNPNNTTVTGPIEIFPTPFDSRVCDDNTNDCLSAPNGITISALMQVLMHRVQYRNFGAYESMVLNHVVDVDGDNLAGIRWYELRKPIGEEWSLYQEGTVSPDDNHRWLGSIAMDASGNIGLGYSVMGPDHTYDLAITGRRSSDPLGVMTIDEQILVEGLSFSGTARWGDYAMMTVDETDGHTFWFTGEYMQEGGTWDWGTRIASFRLAPDDTIDVGPITLLSPQSTNYYTDTEIVEVVVKNFGTQGQTNFNVDFFLNNTFIESKMVTTLLAPDSTVDVEFETLVDLSELGDYKIEIITNLEADQNVLNDTLSTIITQHPKFNLAISGIINLDGIICDSTREIGILLTNLGGEKITSVIIDLVYNSNSNQSINWTGLLESGMSDTIWILLDSLDHGMNQLDINASLPNGMIDEDKSNDSLSTDFQVNLMGELLEFSIQTDGSPTETTWDLKDEMGMILYNGGPYTIPHHIYNEQWCLSDGCYTFSIFDNFGDGIQSGDTSGNYSIIDMNGIILTSLQQSNFGMLEVGEFCTPFICTLEGAAAVVNESSEHSNDGAIMITTTNGTPPFKYSIDDGVNFQSNPLFDFVTSGVYMVVVKDANDCTTSFEIVVKTCTLQIAAIINSTSENQAEGSINVTVEDGIAPFVFSLDGGTTFQDSSVFNNLESGSYAVLVKDSIGCKTTIDVDVGIVSSTDITYVGNCIKIFPNPTTGVFRINISGITDVSTMDVKMFDVNGHVVQRRRLAKYGTELTGVFSLRNLAKGIYYLQFNHKDIDRMAKIIRI